MLHNTLRKKGAAEAANVAVLHSERAAPYISNSNLCGIHAHAELNFRKRPPLGAFKAWGPPYADPYAPFQQITPRRHISKTLESFWFAGGHIAMKPGFFGIGNYKIFRWFQGINLVGVSLALFTYWKKMSVNGWDWKNKGAVFGME